MTTETISFRLALVPTELRRRLSYADDDKARANQQ